MKKSFFKKLSFVLALAMIVSTIAPAAGAFAATSPKVSSAKQYLLLGQATNAYDFNVSNKIAGSTYKWSSSNKAVATVDSKGLTTAKAVGTAKITVKVTTKKKKTYTSTATVIVKDNYNTLTIAGAPADGKVALNADTTFTTTGTTFGGATSSTTAIVRFAVTDKDGKAVTGATITDAGVFKATAPGTYTVVAYAFQSTAKYDAFKTTQTGFTATATATVTVSNAIKSITALKTDSLKVTFEAAATAVDKANFVLSNKATSTKSWIKSVTLSDDKTFATVVTYDTLVSGQTYTLAAKVDGADMTGEIAYTKGTPKTISVTTAQAAPAGTAYAVKYTVLDENGLDITNGTTVYYEDSVGENDGNYTLGNGAIVYVTVCYINPTTGETIKSDKVTITGSNAAAAEFTSFTITKDNAAADFTTPTTSIKKDVTGVYKVKVKSKDQYGNAMSAFSYTGDVKFEALDPSVFVIDTITGEVAPQSVGVGSFRITIGSVSVIKTIEIKAKPVRTSLAVDKTLITVSDSGLNATNVATSLNTANLKYNYKDQYGDNFEEGTGSITIKVISDNNIATIAGSAMIKDYTRSLTSNTDYAIAPVAGTNGGTVVAQLSGNGFTQIVTINVVKADNVRTGYIVDGMKALDIQQNYDNKATTNDYATTLTIYAVNAAGYKVQAVTDGTIEVKAPDGDTVTGATVAFDTTTTNNLKFETGTFNVTAKRNNYIVATGSIAVSDTGVKPAVTVKSNVLTGAVSIANITADLDGLGTNLTVENFKYITGNSSIVAAQTTMGASTVGIVGANSITSTSLYSLTVQIQDSSANNRVWEYNLGTFTAKVS